MSYRSAAMTLLALAWCGLAWRSASWLAERLSLETLGLVVPLCVTVAALGVMQAGLGRLASFGSQGDDSHG
jgi:hypothetical protein